MCSTWRRRGPHDRHHRRPSPHLAAGRPALARRADAAAHLRPLRADPARLSDRRISRRSRRHRRRQVRLCAGQLGRRSAFEDEVAWVQQAADETGWPQAIVGYADLLGRRRAPAARPADANIRCMRGVRMQLHWHENPQYRFAARPDLARRPDAPEAMSRSSPTTAGASTCRCSRRQMAGAAELADACPKVTFVLQHAGMLEDLSDRGLGTAGAPACAARRAAERRLASSRRSAPSSIATIPTHIAAIMHETVGDLRAGALPVRLELPDREALDQLCRAGRRLPDARSNRSAKRPPRRAPRHRGKRLSAQLTSRHSHREAREERMALEIKILDYGDIELNRASWCSGATAAARGGCRRFGFLILGGTWPVVVDTGYRSNQIMETLGMRGLQFHENMIENQLKKHGAAARRRALRAAHPSAHRPRRQGRPLSR